MARWLYKDSAPSNAESSATHCTTVQLIFDFEAPEIRIDLPTFELEPWFEH